MNFIHPDATRAVPAFPNAFVSAPIPTAQALYNRIPNSVHWNLDRICFEGVRYEANVYGYFDAAFASIFPVLQRFQVNPQYPLRPHAEVGQAPHGHKISVSSIGEIHAARRTPREEGMKYPDFVLSKVYPRLVGTPRINCPCALAEIKTSSMDEDDIRNANAGKGAVIEAIDQITAYIERLSTAAFTITRPNSNIIPSFLVYGKYYTQIEYIDGVFEVAPWQYISEEMALPDRAPLLYRLCEIAVMHWDLNG